MYCGHEYAVANLNFCSQADPTNVMIKKKLEELNLLRARDIWTVPNRIEDEIQYNVFMKAACDPNFVKQLGCKNETQAMKYLRDWKNSGQRPML